MESDYIVMFRSFVNIQLLMKEESKMNIGMEILLYERLLYYKVNFEFNMNFFVMDQFNMNLDQYLVFQEYMQNLFFEFRIVVKNFMVFELDDNVGLLRSEIGLTILMSLLEVSNRINFFLKFEIYILID